MFLCSFPHLSVEKNACKNAITYANYVNMNQNICRTLNRTKNKRQFGIAERSSFDLFFNRCDRFFSTEHCFLCLGLRCRKNRKREITNRIIVLRRMFSVVYFTNTIFILRTVVLLVVRKVILSVSLFVPFHDRMLSLLLIV